MDTREEYIKMCRASDEIQEVWAKKNGDFFIEDDNTISTIGDYELNRNNIGYGTYAEDFELLEGKLVWLPRQDQLQEMIDYKYSHRAKVMQDVACTLEELANQSYEQAHLIVTMDMLYQKKWNGTEWV